MLNRFVQQSISVLFFVCVSLFVCQPQLFADSPSTIRVNDKASLLKAIARVKTGGQVIIEEGRYKEVNLKLTQKNIHIKAEKLGKVFFTGDSRIEIAGEKIHIEGLVFTGQRTSTDSIVKIRGRENRFSRCAFIKCNPTKSKVRYHWVTIDGYKNRLDHCLFEGMNHSGVYLVFGFNMYKPGFHLVDHNHFKDRIEGTGNGYETIRIGSSEFSHLEGKVIIENNLFENCDGEAEIISIKTSKNKIVNNTFLNSKGAVTTRQCMGTEIIGNYFKGDGKKEKVGGIRIIGPDQIVRENYFEGLTDRAVIMLEAGNLKFTLGKLYKEGANETTRNGTKAYVFPVSKKTPNLVYNYGQVVDAKIENNLFILSPKQYALAYNVAYGSKERLLRNEGVIVNQNIIVSKSKTSNLCIDKTGNMKKTEVNKPSYKNNIVYNITVPTELSKHPGIKVQKPRFTRDEFGIIRVISKIKVGPQQEPLKATDVGPYKSK